MRIKTKMIGALATVILFTSIGPPTALADKAPMTTSGDNVTIIGSGSTPTNKNVILTIKAEDGLSGVKKIVLPDSTETTETEITYEVSQNGDYVFVVEDNAGNQTTGTVSITGIDKIAPEVTTTVLDTGLTNKPVRIAWSVTDGGTSGFDKIILPDGTESNEPTGEFLATQNDTYKFVAYDKATNSAESEEDITNINTTLPIITVEEYDKEWTKEDVTVKASTDKGTLERDTHTFVENSEYTFKAEDEYGNVGELSVEIEHIDKIKPTPPSIDVSSGLPVTSSGTDILSGIKENRFSITTEGTTHDFVETIDMTGIPAGDFSIIGVSEDIAGNISDENELTVRWNGESMKETDEETEKEDAARKAVDEAWDSLDKTTENPTKPNIGDTQDKIDIARDLIDKLKPGSEKDGLTGEVDEIQDKLDKIKKDIDDLIEEIEKDIEDLEDKDLAGDIQDKIDTLPDGEDKDRLQDDLDNKVKDLEDMLVSIDEARKAVEKAEGNPTKGNIQDAQNKIDKARENVGTIKDGATKDNLNGQLDDLQDRLDKVKKDLSDKIGEIEKDIEDLTDPDKAGDIQDKIDALPEGEDKDKLQDDLDQKLDDLENMEEEEIQNRLKEQIRQLHKESDTNIKKLWDKFDDQVIKDTQSKLDKAKDLLTKVADADPEKAELVTEQDRLQSELNKIKKAIEDLEKEIEKDIEDLDDTADKGDIQDKIDKLPDGPKKDELQDKLDDKIDEIENGLDQEAIEDKIREKLGEAKDQLDKVKEDVTDKNIKDLEDMLDNIQDLIDKLEDPIKKKEYQDEKDAIQKELEDFLEDLKKKVEEIEKDIKDLTDKDKAGDIQDKIDKLPNGDDKDKLQEDLDNKVKDLDDKKEQEELQNDIRDRLDKVEKDIDALEKPADKSDVDKIKKELSDINEDISKVKNPTVKDELQKEHDRIKDKLDKIKIKDDSNWGEGGGDPVKPTDPNKPKPDPIPPTTLPPTDGDNDGNNSGDGTDGDGTNGGVLDDDGILNFGGNGDFMGEISTGGGSKSNTSLDYMTDYQRSIVDRVPYTLKKDAKVDWNVLMGMNIRGLKVDVNTKEAGHKVAEIDIDKVKIQQEVGVLDLPEDALSQYKLPTDATIIPKLQTVINKGYMVGNSQGDLLLDTPLTVVDGLTSFDRFTVDHEMYDRVTGRTVIENKTKDMSNTWYMPSFKSGLGLFKEDHIDNLVGNNVKRILTKGEVAEMVYNSMYTDVYMAQYNPNLNGQNVSPEEVAMTFAYNTGIFQRANGDVNPNAPMTRRDLVDVLHRLDGVVRQVQANKDAAAKQTGGAK